MPRRIKVVGIILIIWLTMLMIDFGLATAEKAPVFAYPKVIYKDGGSAEYYGLGYKVNKYVHLTAARGPETVKVDFGTWWMRFSPPAAGQGDGTLP